MLVSSEYLFKFTQKTFLDASTHFLSDKAFRTYVVKLYRKNFVICESSLESIVASSNSLKSFAEYENMNVKLPTLD